jgi:hypothetical protein
VRLNEAGRRTSELISESQRYVVGWTGSHNGWDYDIGLNHSVNIIRDRDTHGYLLYDQLMAGIADGRINPFGPSSPAGVELINSIQVNQEVRNARGTMDSIDFKVSHAVGTLAGGEAALAVGGEMRREKTEFNPSALLMSDNINNDFAPDGGEATAYARNINAVYGELLLPLTKQLEAQVSARYDHYQVVGGAASPKVGLSYMPANTMLFRASAGRGFRAPSMTELYRPTQVGSTATLPDPVYCATVDNNYADCAENWTAHRYSNPNLKPERSRQFSVGMVLQPSKQVSLSLDYWNIKRTDLIAEIGDDVLLANPAKYGNLVHRDEDGYIDYIDMYKENRGAQKAAGLDLTIDYKGVQTFAGRFGGRLSGTYVTDSKIQNEVGDVYVSNLGRFVTDGVVQRWRHTITLDWDSGPFAASLSNTFSSGYEDQNSAINIDDGSVVAANHVKSYSLWDLSGAWQASKSLKFRAGIQNLFDTAPPYSNQAYHFISGYDPTAADDPELAAAVREGRRRLFRRAATRAASRRALRRNPTAATAACSTRCGRCTARGGVIAGTSAGAAIMSSTMFYEPKTVLATLKQGVADGHEIAPGLGFIGDDVFVDQHLLVRGRFARMLPAMLKKGYKIGLGIDENTAMVVGPTRDVEIIGYKGALLIDLHSASTEPRRLQHEQCRHQLPRYNGDRFNIASGEFTPSPDKADGKLDPPSRIIASRCSTPTSWATRTVVDLMGKLIDSDQLEAIGIDLRQPARVQPDLGFEFRFSRTATASATCRPS